MREKRPDHEQIEALLDTYRWEYEYKHTYWDNGHGQSEHSPHCVCTATGRRRKVWNAGHIPTYSGKWEVNDEREEAERQRT